MPFINPEIIDRSGEKIVVCDTCLSFLSMFMQVERHRTTPVVYSLVEHLASINHYFSTAAEPKAPSERNSQWHQTLIGSCPNRRLIEMIEGQRSAAKRYEHVYMLDPSLISESVRQHQKIIDAISLKNIEAAGRELVENWKFSMDILLVRLREP